MMNGAVMNGVALNGMNGVVKTMNDLWHSYDIMIYFMNDVMMMGYFMNVMNDARKGFGAGVRGERMNDDLNFITNDVVDVLAPLSLGFGSGRGLSWIFGPKGALSSMNQRRRGRGHGSGLGIGLSGVFRDSLGSLGSLRGFFKGVFSGVFTGFFSGFFSGGRDCEGGRRFKIGRSGLGRRRS
ncbi:MAG: hypothetical protein QXS54_05205, partial [Candidatus Methanomethylicaceae archaeon]